MRIYSFLLLFLLFFCTPQKETVTDLDVKRVLDRLATTRLTDSLDHDPSKKKYSRTDSQIFQDICAVQRLKPDLVLEKIKEKDPNLYKELTKKQ